MYYICFSTFFHTILGGPGEVVERKMFEKEIKKDIVDVNVYVIKDPDYHKTDIEKTSKGP